MGKKRGRPRKIKPQEQGQSSAGGGNGGGASATRRPVGRPKGSTKRKFAGAQTSHAHPSLPVPPVDIEEGDASTLQLVKRILAEAKDPLDSPGSNILKENCTPEPLPTHTKILCDAQDAPIVAKESTNSLDVLPGWLQSSPEGNCAFGLSELNPCTAQNQVPVECCPQNSPRAEIPDCSHKIERRRKVETGIFANGQPYNASRDVQELNRPPMPACLNLTHIVANLDNDDLSDYYEVASSSPPGGYVVKEEYGPVLKDIMSRHGDIARDCSFATMKSRSLLLEIACGIYKKLEKSNLIQIKAAELITIRQELIDLQQVKVEVKWLQDRLEEIIEAKQLLRNAIALKESEVRNTREIERKSELLEGYKRELEAHMASVAALQEKIQKEEEELAEAKDKAKKICAGLHSTKAKVKPLYKKSLVHGLL